MKPAHAPFIDIFVSAQEKALYSIDTFIDLSKAIDTVDQDILLLKIQRYTYRDTSMSPAWFRSSLTNRSQIVSLKAHCPYRHPPIAVSPQGPIYWVHYCSLFI